MTAQELRDFLEDHLLRFYTIDDDDCPECREEIGKLQALLRLIDDVERWKDLEKHLGPRDAAYRVLTELHAHTYGGEGKK